MMTDVDLVDIGKAFNPVGHFVAANSAPMLRTGAGAAAPTTMTRSHPVTSMMLESYGKRRNARMLKKLAKADDSDLLRIAKAYSYVGYTDQPPRAKFGPGTDYSKISDPLRPGLQAKNEALKAQRSAWTHEKLGNEGAAALARKRAARGAAAVAGAGLLGTAGVVGAKKVLQRRAVAQQAARRSRNLKIGAAAGAGALALGALGHRRD